MRWLCAAMSACAFACGRIGFAPMADALVPDGGVVLVDIPDLSTCPPELRLVGDATCDGGGLVLAPALANSNGAFWLEPPITIGPDTKLFVEAQLVITMGGVTKGDGFAVVAHSAPSGATTTGGDGDGLGFADIVPSVDIGFDTFQNSWDAFDQTLGVHLDGDWMFPVQTAMSSLDMTTGTPFSVWVDYDEAGDTLAVSNGDGAKPAVPLLTYTQPITNLGTPVWLGMTAGTGGALAEHRVLSLRIVMVP